MLKPIRYSKHNNTLHVGGQSNKLSVFFDMKAARLQIGRRTFHFGNWD